MKDQRETAAKALRAFAAGTTGDNVTAGLLFCIPLAETLDTSCCIQQFLGTGVKRVTCGTYFRSKFTNFGRARFDGVAAVAFDNNIIVLGMDSFFHGLYSLGAWRCTGGYIQTYVTAASYAAFVTIGNYCKKV